MFSFLSKRIITSLFTVLVIAPMLFLVPFTPGSGANVAHAGIFWNILSPGPDDCTISSEGIGNCLLVAVKFFVFDIPKFLFGIVANVFDVLLAFSLSSSIIQNQTFVDKGWVIMRDLSNTFFIFILLYIAISTILQTAGGQIKKLLSTLIMVALFMNFSLYITKVVIDVGNVFALEIYGKIGGADNNNHGYVQINGPGAVQPKRIAGGFGNIFNPYRAGTEIKPDEEGRGLVSTTFIYFACGIIYLIASFVFLTAGFYFLARVVSFWFLMILSPFAFFSMILPSLRGKIWSKWSSELINQTFFAPIFLFFIYLALMLGQTLINGTFFTQGAGPTGQEFIPGLILLFLNAFAIITTLLFGLKTAKGMSGQLGESMAKMGGVATGAAIGVTAWGARNINGFGMRKLLDVKNEKGQSIEDRMRANKLGNFVLSNTKDLGLKGSFDLRNTPGIGMATKMTGLDIGQASKGGYNAELAENIKEKQAEYNSIKDPELKSKYLSSLYKGNLPSNKDAAFALYSNLSANDRREMAQKSVGTGNEAMFDNFAKRLGPKGSAENHKEALINAKDVRDKTTGAITKSKDVVRAEYFQSIHGFGTEDLQGADLVAQLAKNRIAQREAIETMSANDVSDMLSAAKNNTAIGGRTQERAIEDAITQTTPEKQIGIHQAILRDVVEKVDPITGIRTTSAEQRATHISAITDPIVKKTLWSKESSEMRAEILAAGTPQSIALQATEDTLPDDQREQTRKAKILVQQRRNVADAKNDILAAIGTTPVGTPLPPASVPVIHVAMDTLSDNQIASLGPDVLSREEVRDKFNLSQINAINAYGEVGKLGVKTMLKKFVDRTLPGGMLPLPVGSSRANSAKASMKQLIINNGLFNLLDQADKDNINDTQR